MFSITINGSDNEPMNLTGMEIVMKGMNPSNMTSFAIIGQPIENQEDFKGQVIFQEDVDLDEWEVTVAVIEKEEQVLTVNQILDLSNQEDNNVG